MILVQGLADSGRCATAIQEVSESVEGGKTAGFRLSCPFQGKSIALQGFMHSIPQAGYCIGSKI